MGSRGQRGRSPVAGVALALIAAGCVSDPIDGRSDGGVDAFLDLAMPAATPDAAAAVDLAPTPDLIFPGVPILGGGRLVADARGVFVAAWAWKPAGALLLVRPGTDYLEIVAGGSDPEFGIDYTLAADDINLYFAAGGPHGFAIYRLARAGGDPVALAAGRPDDLASDGSYLYWFADKTIQRVPVAGGPSEQILSAGHEIREIAVDADSLYFTQGEWGCMAPECTSVSKMPSAGGAVSTVGGGMVYPWDVAVGGGFLYVHDIGTPMVDCTSPDGRLVQQPLGDGGVAMDLADQVSGLSALVVSNGYVYFTIVGHTCNGAPDPVGALERIRTAGGSVEVLSSKLVEPGAVALDAQRVYWMSSSPKWSPRGPRSWSSPPADARSRRERDHEARALADPGVDVDGAVVLLDDALDDRQP